MSVNILPLHRSAVTMNYHPLLLVTAFGEMLMVVVMVVLFVVEVVLVVGSSDGCW